MPTLKRRQIAAYSAGAFGALLGFTVVPLLFLFYLTEVLKVPPAWAGALLAIPKVADMLLDPWLGRHTDRYAATQGSRGSLLAVSLTTLPVLLVLLFVPMNSLGLNLKLFVLAALLVVQSLLTTVFAVAHTGLAGDLASSIEGRGTLMSARAFGSSAAGLVVSVAAPALVGHFGNGQEGYLGMALVLGFASALLLIVAWRVCGRVPMTAGIEMPTTGRSAGLWNSLMETLSNRQFYSVALMLTLLGAGSGSLIALFPYINQFVLGASPEQLPKILMPVFLALFVGVLVAPKLLRALSQRGAVYLGLGIAMLGLQLLASGTTLPALMMLGSSCFGLGAGILTVLITTLATHSASAPTAGASLGLYLGVLFSAEKLGASAGGVLSGLVLEWAKLAPGTGYSPVRLLAAWYSLPMLTLIGSVVCYWASTRGTSTAGTSSAQQAR